MRVNARFDAEAERQLNYLAETTGLGVSDVLRASVQHYYETLRAQRAGLKHLGQFIGASDSGRADVAGKHKNKLAERWADKSAHDASVPPPPTTRPPPDVAPAVSAPALPETLASPGAAAQAPANAAQAFTVLAAVPLKARSWRLARRGAKRPDGVSSSSGGEGGDE